MLSTEAIAKGLEKRGVPRDQQNFGPRVALCATCAWRQCRGNKKGLQEAKERARKLQEAEAAKQMDVEIVPGADGSVFLDAVLPRGNFFGPEMHWKASVSALAAEVMCPPRGSSGWKEHVSNAARQMAVDFPNASSVRAAVKLRRYEPRASGGAAGTPPKLGEAPNCDML